MKCYIIYAGGGKACTDKKMYWFDREGAYGRKLTASKSSYESDWQVYIKLRIFFTGLNRKKRKLFYENKIKDEKYD